MKIFYFSLLLSFISLSKSEIDEDEIIYNDLIDFHYTENNITSDFLHDCGNRWHSNKKDGILCILDAANSSLGEVENTLMEIINNFENGIESIIKEFITNEPILVNLIKNLLDFKNNLFINKTFEILKNNKDKNDIINNIKNLININTIQKHYNMFFQYLSKILKIEKVHALFNYTYNLYKSNFIKILNSATKRTNISIVFNILKDFIRKYQDSLVECIYKLIAHYDDEKLLIEDAIHFINGTNRDSIINDLKKIASNKTSLKHIANAIELDYPEDDKIYKQIISNSTLTIFILNELKNDISLNFISNLVIYQDDNRKLYEIIPDYISKLNQTKIRIVRDIILLFIDRLFKKHKFNTAFYSGIQAQIADYFNSSTIKIHNMSQSCSLLFNKIYFKWELVGSRKIQKHYIKKIILDSSKNKNDFLTYENCIKKKKEFKRYTINKEAINIIPKYIVGIIEDKVNKTKLKKSMLFEKYDYLINLCLPQGINIDNGNTPMCKEEDYEIIIKFFKNITFNMNNSTITSFILDEDNSRIEAKDYFLFAISIILLMIPLIINIFLVLSKKILIKKYNKSIIIKELKKESLDDKEKNKEKEIKILDENEDKLPPQFMTPKWYQLLIEYFDIIKNIIELFNFSISESNSYNINGITYIKGILGISIILYIFGQTFFILFNIPTSLKVIYGFYKTITNPLYIILFIGLRYSPRIIFSCSGYILMYKFLNFIEKEKTYYFIKFFIFQSYKYILLICVTVFFRFFIFSLDTIFRFFKSPIVRLLKGLVAYHDSDYFLNIFTFLFYNWIKEGNISNKNTIQYFYIPINEVFLFLVGTTIISIGYKFKLRIDYFIIFIILIIYLSKFLCYIFDKEERYSTLYFSLSDYGAFMINPLFNLPSFLIGMYFGMVNYIIQRGINNSKKSGHYIPIESLSGSGSSLFEIANDDNGEKNFKILNKQNTFNRYHKIFKIKNEKESNDFSSNSNEENNIISTNDKNLSNTFAKSSLEIYNEKLKEIPFLMSAVNFTDFHRINHDKKYIKIITGLSIVLIVFLSLVQYIYIIIYAETYLEKNGNDLTKLALEKIIPNKSLNIIYVLDIELVVFIINWVFFVLSFEIKQIIEFLNHYIWIFFIKSYFSIILTSTPIIIYLFYLSETVIKVTLSNIFLYSLINIILIFFGIVFFYSSFELPLKKIFKTFKIGKTRLNSEDYGDEGENEPD